MISPRYGLCENLPLVLRRLSNRKQQYDDMEKFVIELINLQLNPIDKS